MEKATNYIALAIPVFFILIGLELWISKRRNLELYRFNDTVNDISMGILQQVVGILAKGLIFLGYLTINSHWKIWLLPSNSGSVWILGFVGVDFCYYWFHRLSHEINIIWGSHVAHHQSEEYNLSVALRQGAIQNFFSAAFYWPLALIGLPPLVFLALTSFNTLYQFWIHTRAIDKMWRPFEAIFNTP